MDALSLIDTFRENEERARKPLTPLQDKTVPYITLFCCHSSANCVLSYLALEVTLLWYRPLLFHLYVSWVSEVSEYFTYPRIVE